MTINTSEPHYKTLGAYTGAGPLPDTHPEEFHADGRRLPRGQKAPLPLPSVEALRAAFECDADRGTLTWKPNPAKPKTWNARYAGRLVGHQAKSGYSITMLDGVKHRTHRIIWKMCSGEDAPFLIDHVNGDQTDNRFSNLREATFSQNTINRGQDIDSMRGVYLHKKSGKYHARINLEEGCLSLGYYSTAEEGAKVYRRAAMKYHGGFLRHVGVELKAAYSRIEELERALKCIDLLVDVQADDEGLWFIDPTCAEAYVQAGLRRLHAEIETRVAEVL